MNNFNRYPTQHNAEQFHGQPGMPPTHMVYPHMGAMPAMAPVHGYPQMMPYHAGPYMDHMQPMHQAAITSKPPMTRASHVISEPCCHIYMTDMNSEATEITTRQIIAFDGKVFIEHLPNHNVIFAPIKIQPQHVLQSAGSRVAKLKLKPTRADRPKNVFFKYRSQKVKELQELYPKLNQIVISRIAAEHWKNESREVKERYRREYRNEMAQYELAKKINKAKSNGTHAFLEEYGSGLDLYSDSDSNQLGAELSGQTFNSTPRSEPAAQFRPSDCSYDAELPYSESFIRELSADDALTGSEPALPSIARMRSHTMPAPERLPTNISNIVD
ncbi:hypothetical protein GGI07_002828 [Coemansia sp. Benny D115]|nr:hypothetical protein GGI07_002828 [Coemansia sp. Benny D115]